MLLTFSLPGFEGLIKDNIKQHSFRSDKHNRWKVGNTIQFWMGNPRNVHAKIKPRQFGTGICSRVVPAEIYPGKNEIIIDGNIFNNTQVLNQIAINDGFESWEEMKTFFTEDFVGKIIFWKGVVNI